MNQKLMNLKQVNKKLQNVIGKKRFADRIEELIKEGMVEIVDCEEDGTPIVNITDKGMNTFLNEIGNT